MLVVPAAMFLVLIFIYKLLTLNYLADILITSVCKLARYLKFWLNIRIADNVI